jgi:DNA primase
MFPPHRHHLTGNPPGQKCKLRRARPPSAFSLSAFSSVPVIKPSCLRDLKLRANLADVVGRSVTLRKAGGGRLKGLCPFHQEKTPSFHVDADKGLFHCFGCNKSGDAITFVRETEQLNFTEAVEALGQRFGIVIEYEEGSGGPGPEQRSLRQELFALHELAAEHFHQAFKGAGAAGTFMRDYWTTRRKFSLELADEFKVGAVDAAGGGLGAMLLARKFSEAALRQCGLFFIYDDALLTPGALRPRFRGRLMIPIRDHQGRVVAFTARQTDLTPADDPAREAKYVNSPETPIFTKGNLLFNLDRARSHVGEGKPFVLVEGQLDAMRCWSVGLQTAVAPQGTAITEGQLALLLRYHPQVECFFDSDSAGQKAADRFLHLALPFGLDVRFLRLTGAEKLDPDVLFLERKIAVYEDLKKNSLDAISFACRYRLPDPLSASDEARVNAAKQVTALIDLVQDPIRHSFLQKTMMRELAIGSRSILDEIRSTFSATSTPKVESAIITPEHHLLYMCLHFEHLGRPLAAMVAPDWIDASHPAGALLNRFLNEFEHDGWPGRDHLDALLETDAERALVAALLFDAPRIDAPAKVAAEGLRLLRARALEPRLRQIELALAGLSAESSVDANSLLKQRTELQRQLRAPLGLPAPA